MKRRIDADLQAWRTSEQRKVLLVRGARQVGKTHSVRQLGRSFSHFLEVNFEEELPVSRFFESSLNPTGICENLHAYFDVPIVPGESLLFFDEIQACPNALRALRFFYERMPDLHVVAAGSLLEFALDEIPSFGVGRVTTLFLYPLSFSEFLEASARSALLEAVGGADADHRLDETLHDQLLGILSTYLLIGGMPAVVSAYIEHRDVRRCQLIIDELLTSMRDDFAKYRNRVPASRLEEVFESAALQAGRKFKYANISQDIASRSYKDALELLRRAGLVYRIHHSSARGFPLSAQLDLRKFKVLPFDVGIFQRVLGLDLSEHLVSSPSEFVNKGALAEVFAGLELVAHGSPRLRPQLFYWHREARGSNAEIDYLIQRGDEMLAIEVKSGTTGRMQSLRIFLQERNPSIGYRVSHENFGRYGEIETLPLYAVHKLIS